MSNLHQLKMVAVLFANLHIKKTIIQIWFQRTSQTLENYGTKWNTFCIKKQTIYFRIVHAILNLLALSMIFFISKIAKIRDTLLSAKPDANIHNEPTPPAAPNPLLTFSQISESNVSKLIRSSPSKFDLDPCPTQIVKDSADILAGSITMIKNLSLAEVPRYLQNCSCYTTIKKLH